LFSTNKALLNKVQIFLSRRRNLWWLIGGAGSGKSTICRALAVRTGIPVYDMDEHVFRRYRFDRHRHPATTAWFAAENPLSWMLSLSWPEFDALYRAANAEMLDLLADDLAGRADAPLLVDGGITHPSVLVRAVPAGRVICLERDEMARAREWETAGSRAEMKASVLALPDGEMMWRRFLEYDRRMTETIAKESRACGIRILSWDKSIGVELLARTVGMHLAFSIIDV
jgi:hypothetical protein